MINLIKLLINLVKFLTNRVKLLINPVKLLIDMELKTYVLCRQPQDGHEDQISESDGELVAESRRKL